MKEYEEMEQRKDDAKVVSNEMEETKTETIDVEGKTEEEQILGMLDDIEESNRRPATLVAVMVGVVVVVLAIVIIALTIASGKKKQIETTGNVENQEVTTEETSKEEQVVVMPEPTVKPTSEPTAEPTPEPTPEPIVYEGIDMESTLPGTEWVETFVGIIEEPKFVVFNDETNKKIIVENEQEVEFEEGDTVIAFVPDGITLINFEGTNVKELYNFYDERHYMEVIFLEGTTITPNDISVEVCSYFGEYFGKLTCKLR